MKIFPKKKTHLNNYTLQTHQNKYSSPHGENNNNNASSQKYRQISKPTSNFDEWKEYSGASIKQN